MKSLNDSGGSGHFFGRRPDDLLVHTGPRKLARNDSIPYHFGFARTALKYGLRALGFKPGDVLLVPDFNCESLLEPLYSLGVEPCYYPVDQRLVPEWTTLNRLVVRSAKALLVVHYFGQPQPIKDCVDFCRKHTLMLIEDNAHGFGGTLNGHLLGTFGEIGISAPRKSFPIKNGALLYVKSHRKVDLTSLQLQPIDSSSKIQRCKHLIKNVPIVKAALKKRRNSFAFKRRLGPPPPYGSQEAFRDPPISHDYGMDQYIEQFLAYQDIAKIRKKRQEIYELWRQWAETQGLAPVFPTLSPGALPLVFPAYSRSAIESRQWYVRGHRAGVDIHSWPTLPRAVVEQNDNAMRLWERMICFPIHQGMDISMLKHCLASI